MNTNDSLTAQLLTQAHHAAPRMDVPTHRATPVTAQKYGEMFLNSSHRYGQSINRLLSPTLTRKQKVAIVNGANRKKPGFSSVRSMLAWQHTGKRVLPYSPQGKLTLKTVIWDV